MLRSNGDQWILKFAFAGLGLYLGLSLFQEAKSIDAQPNSSQSYKLSNQLERGNQPKYNRIKNQKMRLRSIHSRVITAADLRAYFQENKSDIRSSDFIHTEQALVFDARNLYPKFYLVTRTRCATQPLASIHSGLAFRRTS